MSLPKLDFRLLSSSSSEITEGSLDELKKPLSKSKGWHSSKYCTYPQNIYIAFDTPINLRQINLLSHEKKISEKISFYAYCPQGDISIKDYKTIPYLNFGYIKLNDNSNNNFKAREFKKVFVDVKCLYLRIDLNKNYNNGYNPFNQVSLINIEFFGYKLPGYKNSLLNIEITDENQEKLEDLSPTKNNIRNRESKSFNIFMNEICGEKIRELQYKLSESTRNQNSNECFRIKECINEINNIGKKIYELQKQKNEAVTEENFDKAMELKQSIDILSDQLNRIDINPKKTRSKRKHNSAKKNNSTSSSGNNSFIDNDENILEEIKEEKNENDIDNNIKFNKKKIKKKKNSINNPDLVNNSNMINNINDLNNYNITNYSSISNNTKTIDLSQGKIITNLNTDRKNSIEFQDDDFYKQFDDRMVPAVKKKLQLNKSLEEIDEDNKEIYKKELEPLEEVSKENLENYDLLLDYIEEDGLRKILSNQYEYKIQGFKLLSQNLKKIFRSSDIEDIIYILFKLIAELFEDKKTAMNIKFFDLILDIFKHLSNNLSKIEMSKELVNFINDRILNKIILKLNDSSENIRSKSYNILIFILYNKIINFDLLIIILLSNDIKNKNNNYYITTRYSIIAKLDIINNILENYSKIVNEGICPEENFPKNVICDYLIINITSSKNEIKNKCRPIMELAINKLGLKIFKEKLMDFSQKDIEKLKIRNLKQITDFLKEINNNLNLSPDYTMRESISRMNSNKPNEEGRKKSKSRSRSKSKEDNKKIENYNKCSICQKQLGNDNIIEHMKRCVMCHQCKKCKVFVEVKNLTEHRLNQCSKKDKFKLCQRCREAIPIELYDEHTKNNKCNQYKKNCNRCPLCHEDIPLSKDGFFKHLSIDGCPYKIKYKKKEK